MVIDYQTNAADAVRYAVFDAKTGKRLDDKLPIFYADDVEGLVRYYRRDANGRLLVCPDTGERIVIEEARKIDIVRKA